MLILTVIVSADSVGAAEVRLASTALERSVIALSELCELTIRVEGTVKNPYDPEEVNLEAVFQPPRGRPVIVTGFYYQPFVLEADARGQEVLRPTGEPVWKVRFTPRSLGLWSYEVQLRTRHGLQSVPGKRFEVIDAANRGFVRLDRSLGALRWERGDLFVPVGENLCWPPKTKPLQTYDQWFQELAQEQANYIRVWMAPWFLRLETKETGVGRYDQARAWQLDYLLQQSDKLGLYWQLCLLDHGSFSQSQNPDWHNNPYNERLGGMCRLPSDFATDPRAKTLFRQLLRYMVSRWGYSRTLVMWELFNEANYSDIRLEQLVPWIAEMSAYLHTLDLNHRPVTISFHRTSPAEVWRIPTIDVVQLHEYDQPDFAGVFGGPAMASLRRQYRKPVQVGEFGWINEFVRQIDAAGLHLHDGIWSSVMGGAMGSALVWYWDAYVHPNHLQRHYRPLARFWHDEQQVVQRLQPLNVTCSDSGLMGTGIGSSQRAYLWIKNRAHNLDQYLAYRCELAKQRLRRERGEQAREAVSYPPRVVDGATVTVQGLEGTGRYRVEWWDPYHGTITTNEFNQAFRGTLTLKVPSVAFDVAVKLIKLPWWERG